jgi:hypothetical protein
MMIQLQVRPVANALNPHKIAYCLINIIESQYGKSSIEPEVCVFDLQIALSNQHPLTYIVFIDRLNIPRYNFLQAY